MATVFWDAKGILFVDYLAKGKTINGEYFANLLDQLRQKIREKRPGLAKKKILVHQDNAPCHKSAIAMAKIHQLGFELLPHAAYSPDLAPSDFSLFPNLKKFHAGKKFASDLEVIAASNAYFEELYESAYKDGIKALEYRWNKCIQLEGDYVEK
jgi:histone-lysine N-methyltransferase SETMAR